MFSLLVFNKDIIFKICKCFVDIENMFFYFFKKSENNDIEMVKLIKDKEIN